MVHAAGSAALLVVVLLIADATAHCVVWDANVSENCLPPLQFHPFLDILSTPFLRYLIPALACPLYYLLLLSSFFFLFFFFSLTFSSTSRTNTCTFASTTLSPCCSAHGWACTFFLALSVAVTRAIFLESGCNDDNDSTTKEKIIRVVCCTSWRYHLHCVVVGSGLAA